MKLLRLLVLSVWGILLAQTSVTTQAAIPSIDGTGAVLVFPYYTVNGGHDTLLSIANSTSDTKAVKVRIIDSGYGKEVLDFNLYLGPRDNWTGALSKSTEGGALLSSKDNSCTLPMLPKQGIALTTINFNEFVDNKPLDHSLARTTEGFIEVYEMGTVVDIALLTYLKRGATRECSSLSSAFDDKQQAPSAVRPPSGGLWGSATLIHVQNGISFSYDAEALNQVHKGQQHTGPGHPLPSFQNAHPSATLVDGEKVYTATFDGDNAGPKAVSALWMRSEVMSEWTTERAISAQTSLVITLPTARFFMRYCEDKDIEPFTSHSFCLSTDTRANVMSLNEEVEKNSNYFDYETRTPEKTRICLLFCPVFWPAPANFSCASL